jgi:hypothetical protein
MENFSAASSSAGGGGPPLAAALERRAIGQPRFVVRVRRRIVATVLPSAKPYSSGPRLTADADGLEIAVVHRRRRGDVLDHAVPFRFRPFRVGAKRSVMIRRSGLVDFLRS